MKMRIHFGTCRIACGSLGLTWQYWPQIDDLPFHVSPFGIPNPAVFMIGVTVVCVGLSVRVTMPLKPKR